MGYLSLKNILKSEYGAKKFYCKVDYKPYKILVDLHFSLSEEGLKEFNKRVAFLENSVKDFSYSFNKYNRVHITCTLS